MDTEELVENNDTEETNVTEEETDAENGEVSGGDDQDGSESEEEDESSDNDQEEDASLEWGDDSQDDSSHLQFANQEVLGGLESNPAAKAAYESQLNGFGKLHANFTEFQTYVDDVFSGTKAHQANESLEANGMPVRVINVSNPQVLSAEITKLVKSLGEKDQAFLEAIPVDAFLDELDPREIARDKRLAELERRTRDQEEMAKASNWKSLHGKNMAAVFEKQTGKAVDADLLYRVHRAGHRPKNIPELLDAIGRVDFDSYKGLVDKKTVTKKPVPGSATAKTSSKSATSGKLSEINSNRDAWLRAVR